MDKKIAKAGTLLQVEEGAYSDYQVMGFFVVLQDFDPMAELAVFLEQNPTQRGEPYFSSYDFLGYLASKGLLLDIPHATLDLGAYGSSRSVRFTPVSEA